MDIDAPNFLEVSTIDSIRGVEGMMVIFDAVVSKADFTEDLSSSWMFVGHVWRLLVHSRSSGGLQERWITQDYFVE